MRLGEIRNIINRVVDENGAISIAVEAMYGNQAYKISNYAMLMEALKVLNEQEWNDFDFEQVQNLIDRYKPIRSMQIIEVDEYNRLEEYVSSINHKLPIFIGLLGTIVADQKEQTINIKLPSQMNSLQDLNSLNDRLDKVFKKFNIDGKGVEFKGFDTGSDWYIFVAIGPLAYQVIVGCMKIANDFLVMKKNYYQSKKAELDYRASLKKEEEFTNRKFEAFKDKRLNLEIEEGVAELIKQLEERNGHTQAEAATKLVKATKELIEIMGDGAEFHLSLNPPKYITEESSGKFTIDYSKLPKSQIEKKISSLEMKDNDKKEKPNE